MSNSCRNVECPACGHRFMWIEVGSNSCTEYFDKETNEVYPDAICPLCGKHMAVIPKKRKGLPDDASSIICFIGRPL